MGRTKVHAPDCPFRGMAVKLVTKGCTCPTSSAAGSVDSMIGQLRAIFRDKGRGTDWIHNIGVGNPAAAPQIKSHLKAVKLEQKAALVKPKQATPLMYNNILPLSRYLSYKVALTSDAGGKYVALRDRAFFKLIGFAGDRGNDLGLAETGEIQCLPNEAGNINGYLFCHTLGKTLRGNTTNSFWVWKSDNPDLCPVTELQTYIKASNDLGIDLQSGYLFRPYCPKTRQTLNKPISTTAMNARLESHLRNIRMFGGETVHGARAGTAITLELLGVPRGHIQSHIGWGRDSRMLDHYTSLPHVQGKQQVAQAMSAASTTSPATGKCTLEELGDTYATLAFPDNLQRAFPLASVPHTPS